MRFWIFLVVFHLADGNTMNRVRPLGYLVIDSISVPCESYDYFWPDDVDSTELDNRPNFLNAEVTSSAELCCGFSIEPPLLPESASVTWYKAKNDNFQNLDTLQANGIVKKKDNTYFSIYTISNVTFDDKGFYICKVEAPLRQELGGAKIASFLSPIPISVYAQGLQFEKDKYDKNIIDLHSKGDENTILRFTLKEYTKECDLVVSVTTNDDLFSYYVDMEQQAIILHVNAVKRIKNFKENLTVNIGCKDTNLGLTGISRTWSLSGFANSQDACLSIDAELLNVEREKKFMEPTRFVFFGNCDNISWVFEIVYENDDGNEKNYSPTIKFESQSDNYSKSSDGSFILYYKFLKFKDIDNGKSDHMYILEITCDRSNDVARQRGVGKLQLKVNCERCRIDHLIVGSTFTTANPVFDKHEAHNCFLEGYQYPDTIIWRSPCCTLTSNSSETVLYHNGQKNVDSKDGIPPLDVTVNKTEWYMANLGYFQCYVTGTSRVIKLGKTEVKAPYYKAIIMNLMKQDIKVTAQITSRYENTDVSMYIFDEMDGYTTGDQKKKRSISNVKIAVNDSCVGIKLSTLSYPAIKFRKDIDSSVKLYGDEGCTGNAGLPASTAYSITQDFTFRSEYQLYIRLVNTIDVKVHMEDDLNTLPDRTYQLQLKGKHPYLDRPNFDVVMPKDKRKNSGKIPATVTSCNTTGYPISYIKIIQKLDTKEHVLESKRDIEEESVSISKHVNTNGEVYCEVRNHILNITLESKTKEISLYGPESNTLLIIAAVLGLVAILILVYCICVCVRKRQRPDSNLRDVMCCITDYQPIEKIPLVDKYKLEFTSLNMGTLLGAGNFGQVVKAWSKALPDFKDEKIDVAIKSVKPCTDRFKRESDLLYEKDLMLRVAGHRNVCRCYGYTSEPDPVTIVLELAEFGSLDKLLINARKARTDGYLLPDETLDDAITTFQPHHIVEFSRQIADGMDFIGSKDIVHRDLAARNVLVGGSKQEYILKITDFGLARDVSTCGGIYERHIGREIPIKWTAPESLADMYTVKSDVWSYGVTLWELCTLGGEPYHGMANAEIKERLRGGYRLAQPPSCHDDVYQLMRSCWWLSPEDRPSFRDILTELETWRESPSDYVSTVGLYESELDVSIKLATLSASGSNHNNVQQSSRVPSGNSDNINNSNNKNQYTPDPHLPPENVTISPTNELNV